jgi:membrane-associated phospholipid phosphatase
MRGQGDTLRPAPVVSMRDAGVLLLGVGVSALAQRGDLTVRREVRSAGWQENGMLDAADAIGNPWGAPGVMAVSTAMWVGGRVWDRPVLAATGLRAVEAIAISGVVTGTIKGIVGRARPRVNANDSWDVELWRGYNEKGGDHEAMPSGHTTAAFAFASAVTSELSHRKHPRTKLIGITAYTLAAATGYARMHSDAHWLSDVTMGAAIGTVTGWAVTRWHATRPDNRLDRLLLGADQNGALFGVGLSWR